MFTKLFLAAFVLKALLVSADPTPSVPGPGDSYKEGGDCVIEWGLDSTGKWTDMQIELKTGNNWAMVPLQAITTIDATKETRYVYPCPDVSPNSAIYFYEFTSSSSTEKYWTTRFTITDEDGNSTPPTEHTQPNGDSIPWGTGTLATVNGGGSPPDSSPSDPASDPASSPASLPPSSSSGLPGDSSSILSSSSRLSSTRTPVPTQTSVNTTSSQSNSNGDMAVAVSKTIVFAIGLVTASTAFLL